MKLLVTGANGFVGRYTVARLLERGHDVRVFVRPSSNISRHAWNDKVEVFRADLRARADLSAAFEGIDAVLHIAAAVSGDDDDLFVAACVCSENLLTEMAKSKVRRLILCSSFSVYDWSAANGVLDESVPMRSDFTDTDGYMRAKVWQERLVRKLSQEHGFQLTVLRPGFVWGPGREFIDVIGRGVGPLWLMLGGALTRIPITHVENCADCFAAVTECDASIGQTLNVVDGDDVRVWRYLRAYLKITGGRMGLPVSIPYSLMYRANQLMRWTTRLLFDGKGKLPSIFMPVQFEATYKPVRFPTKKLKEIVGWTPPYSFDEAVERTIAARA